MLTGRSPDVQAASQVAAGLPDIPGSLRPEHDPDMGWMTLQPSDEPVTLARCTVLGIW
jgi:hypothetical protein